MAARIDEIHRIIIAIAIAIEVQAVDGFGVQIGSIVRADEAAPFGGVISGVAIIQAGIIRTIIAISTKTGALTIANPAYSFYHLPRTQSRKMPHPDGCGKLH